MYKIFSQPEQKKELEKGRNVILYFHNQVFNWISVAHKENYMLLHKGISMLRNPLIYLMGHKVQKDVLLKINNITSTC